METALVTGGAGFLGSHLVDGLLAWRFDVVVFDSLVTGSRSNLAHLDGDPRVTVYERDVAEPLDVWGEVDVVFHLASPASPQHYLAHPLETLRASAFGTLHALELAQAKRARFVYASSSEAYGNPTVVPQHETYTGNVNTTGPRAVYAEGKRYGEAMTSVYRGLGLDTTIVRPFNTYGPRLRPDDGRVVPAFMRAALAGEPLVVAGDGSQTRSLCYVSDLVNGLVRAGLGGAPGPINLGNPQEISMLDLAAAIIDVCDSSSSIEFGPRPVDDPVRRVPDISRAVQQLGWRPRVSLAEGLRRTRDAWLADG